MPRQARLPKVDPVAAQGDALLVEQLALPLSHREAPVGPDDPVPRQLLVGLRKYAADQPWRIRVDVAVRPDEAFGDRPDSGDDARSPAQRGSSAGRRPPLWISSMESSLPLRLE